jgi:hypothetical protein
VIYSFISVFLELEGLELQLQKNVKIGTQAYVYLRKVLPLVAQCEKLHIVLFLLLKLL